MIFGLVSPEVHLGSCRCMQPGLEKI